MELWVEQVTFFGHMTINNFLYVILAKLETWNNEWVNWL